MPTLASSRHPPGEALASAPAGEERLRLALDAGGIGTWVVDLASSVATLDERAGELVGIDAGRAVPLDQLLAAIHPDHRETVKERFTAARRGERGFAVAMRVLDGAAERWLELDSRTVFGQQGEPLFAVGVVSDLEESKRSEQRLREAEESQRFLAEVGVALAASLEWDDTLARIVDLSMRFLADCCVIDVAGESDPAARVRIAHREAENPPVAQALERVLLDRTSTFLVGEVLASQRPVLRADLADEDLERLASNADQRMLLQSLRPCSLLGLPLVARGHFLGAIAFVATRRGRGYGPHEQWLAENLAHRAALAIDNARLVRALRRRERELSFLADASRMLAELVDVGPTFTRIAELLVPRLADWATLHLSSESGEITLLEAVHRDPEKARVLRDLVSRYPPTPEANPETFTSVRKLESILASEVSREQVRANARNEEHLRLLEVLGIASVIVVPLVARGRLLGILLLVRGPEGRRYETDDLALAEEFARRAALAIDNARLYEQARHATHGRDVVLGVVAHDLRNPLNTIRMSVDLALHWTPPTAPVRRPLDTIVRAADRMNRLVGDLLDVASIESGRLSIVPKPCAPDGLVSAAVEAQQALAASASIELRSTSVPALPDVLADSDRVLQVFANLVGNAISAMKQGGVIELGAEREGQGEVRFWVCDTGPGIPDDHAVHIFDRFWRHERARSRGAGLGLTISKGIVEAHGGRIWFSTQLNRGTTFSFTLPVARRR